MERRIIDLNDLDSEMDMGTFAIYIKRRANFKYEKCGSNEDLQAHHIIPRSKEGKTNFRNGICLCKECHKKEHAAKFKVKVMVYIPLHIREYAYKRIHSTIKYMRLNDVYNELLKAGYEAYCKKHNLF